LHHETKGETVNLLDKLQAIDAEIDQTEKSVFVGNEEETPEQVKNRLLDLLERRRQEIADQLGKEDDER
jgi:hypothetical protein